MALCGSIPIVVTITTSLVCVTQGMAAAGTPDHNVGLPLAFASYEPHHGRSIDGQTVRSRDTTTAPGTSRVTLAETSKLQNRRSAATHIINQARLAL